MEFALALVASGVVVSIIFLLVMMAAFPRFLRFFSSKESSCAQEEAKKPGPIAGIELDQRSCHQTGSGPHSGLMIPCRSNEEGASSELSALRDTLWEAIQEASRKSSTDIHMLEETMIGRMNQLEQSIIESIKEIEERNKKSGKSAEGVTSSDLEVAHVHQSPEEVPVIEVIEPVPVERFAYTYGASPGDSMSYDLGAGIFKSNPKGYFQLMTRPGAGKGGLFLVPKISRFESAATMMHLKEAYECKDCRPGQVMIVNPAVVEMMATGVKLKDKGILEIAT